MIIDWASGARAQLLAYQWPVWNWSTGSGGAAPAPAPEVQTYSGGLVRAPANSRPETKWRDVRDESETERKARIHAERVKRGILPPDPVDPTAAEAQGATIAGGGATLLPPELAGFDAAAYDALAADLAGIYTGAYLDQLIAENFRILDDEEDAAVLLLAIATLH